MIKYNYYLITYDQIKNFNYKCKECIHKYAKIANENLYKTFDYIENDCIIYFENKKHVITKNYSLPYNIRLCGLSPLSSIISSNNCILEFKGSIIISNLFLNKTNIEINNSKERESLIDNSIFKDCNLGVLIKSPTTLMHCRFENNKEAIYIMDKVITQTIYIENKNNYKQENAIIMNCNKKAQINNCYISGYKIGIINRKGEIVFCGNIRNCEIDIHNFIKGETKLIFSYYNQNKIINDGKLLSY